MNIQTPTVNVTPRLDEAAEAARRARLAGFIRHNIGHREGKSFADEPRERETEGERERES